MFALLNLIAILGYGLYLITRLQLGATNYRPIWLLLLVLLAHMATLLLTLLEGRFGFFSSLSLASWMCVALVLFIPRLAFVLIWFAPVALLSVGLNAYFNNIYHLTSNNQIALLVHVATAMLSLAMCSLLTIVLAYYRMRSAQLKQLTRSQWADVPALEAIERVSHYLLYAAFITLGAGLVTGVVFLQDLFAQHLAHKTFFSIAAWLVLLIACILHARARGGWAVIFWYVLCASMLLALGYFGSRFVLEFILADS